MDFIVEYSNTIPDSLCDDIVVLFLEYINEKNTQKMEIPKDNINWKKIERFLYKELLTKINSYKTHFIQNSIDNESSLLLNENMYLRYFLIKMYETVNTTEYIENYDRINSRYNVLTFVFFLNTVENGGTIYFENKMVNAEKGKLILFPDKTKYNCCLPISNNQIIITGQLSSIL